MIDTSGRRELAALVALVLLGAGATLSGCNTVEGVGEDIEATGEALQDAADDDDDE